MRYCRVYFKIFFPKLKAVMRNLNKSEIKILAVIEDIGYGDFLQSLFSVTKTLEERFTDSKDAKFMSNIWSAESDNIFTLRNKFFDSLFRAHGQFKKSWF